METITTESAVSVQGTILIAVVRTFFKSEDKPFARWLAASKQPLAIIVCNKNGVHAFDMQSAEISMDSLREIMPGLNKTLEPYLSQQNR
ncbi:MAG: hypothetical protein OEY11_04590 [Gammaproteobacteria bacterium]|nr:hypothetical protein [Gammaproteobacteria bacterium]